MRAGISPKDFAEAIGVSESSVKRWVDQGTLKAARTAGGHRRIAREEALRFIREQQGQLVRPDKLGLVPDTPSFARSAPLARAAEQLHGFLTTGKEPEVRGLVSGLYLGGHPIWAIADEVFRPALERIGRLWIETMQGVYIEHRATELCLRAVDELRGLLPTPPTDTRKRAVVASGELDFHMLPSALAGLTLTELGWQVTGLGSNTPLSVAMMAVRDIDARLVALSFTETLRPEVAQELASCAEALALEGRHLVIGGRAVGKLGLGPHERIVVGGTLGELANLARRL